MLIELAAYVIAIAVTALCVGVHYLAMKRLHARFGGSSGGVVWLVGGLIAAHAVEIWLFGIAYFALAGTPFGSIHQGSSLLDSVYFSAACYTTLGIGDLYPIGPLRAMAATEGLVGLVFIAWSASLVFLHLQKRLDW